MIHVSHAIGYSLRQFLTTYDPSFILQELCVFRSDPLVQLEAFQTGRNFKSQLSPLTFLEFDREMILLAISHFRWSKKDIGQLMAKVCSLSTG